MHTIYDKLITDEDRFILSKGHACWVYYVLLREKNFNPVLEGHPHLDLLNGVHWTTGSEGHGPTHRPLNPEVLVSMLKNTMGYIPRNLMEAEKAMLEGYLMRTPCIISLKKDGIPFL